MYHNAIARISDNKAMKKGHMPDIPGRYLH